MKDASRDLGEQVDLELDRTLFPADTEINRAQFPELYFQKSETSGQLNELQSIVPLDQAKEPDQCSHRFDAPDRSPS